MSLPGKPALSLADSRCNFPGGGRRNLDGSDSRDPGNPGVQVIAEGKAGGARVVIDNNRKIGLCRDGTRRARKPLPRKASGRKPVPAAELKHRRSGHQRRTRARPGCAQPRLRREQERRLQLPQQFQALPGVLRVTGRRNFPWNQEHPANPHRPARRGSPPCQGHLRSTLSPSMGVRGNALRPLNTGSYFHRCCKDAALLVTEVHAPKGLGPTLGPRINKPGGPNE